MIGREKLYVVKRGNNFIAQKISLFLIFKRLIDTQLLIFVYIPDGRKEPVMYDKITSRIEKLCFGLNNEYIDPVSFQNVRVYY